MRIEPVEEYDAETLYRVLGGATDALGGIKRFVRPGDRVLLKPNLLYPALPERAIVTHPEVLGAAARLVRDAGGVPLAGDSPPFRSAAAVLSRSGFDPVIERYGIEVVEFRESRPVESTVGRYRWVDISAEVLSADVVINLPKWKTHAQMGLTLAVKNLFGCVVGNRKPEWHYRAGDDHDLFAEVILAVAEAVRPALSVLDGVVAMEGDGPGTGGRPTSVRRIVVGEDPVAVDTVVANLIGAGIGSLPVLKAARRHGRLPAVVPEGCTTPIIGFRLPGSRMDLMFGPRFMRGVVRRRFTPRPLPRKELCRSCGDCLRYCPARAVALREGGGVDIDREACIRCFCCLEVCPHGAIGLQKGLFRRLSPSRKTPPKTRLR